MLAIVVQSGGRVQVETAPGTGSTFNIDLPRVRPAVLPRPRLLAEPASRGSGVVLLVEDDKSVREFARRSLEAAGHTVLAAEHGAQAIRASERWGEEIDVLVTDIVMPGIHGVELAARIREQRPGINVVFASGYGPGDLDGEIGEVEPGEFLAKPYSGVTLCRAVNRAVAARRRIAP